MSSNYGKKCCRVCSVTRKAVHNFKLLLSDGLADLFDIFSGGFKISKNDDLPKYICNVCVDDLMICKRFRENCQNTALKFTVNSLNQETIPIDQCFDQVFVNLDVSFDIQNESVDRLLTEETSKEEKQECIPDLLDDKIDAENLIDVDLRKSSRKILKKSKLKDTKQTPTKSDDEIGNPERIKNICEICHKSFYKLEYYEAHLRWHDGDLKPYECAACKKRLKTEHCLRAHMLNHRRLIKAFKCPDCEGTYANNSLLQIHILSKHTAKTIPCNQCPKMFSTNKALMNHGKVHSDLRLFGCNHCDKSFKNAHILKHHQLVHNTEKNFVCHKCSKAFKDIEGLRTHELQHIDPEKRKKYECDQCDKRFFSKSAYSDHKKYGHSGLIRELKFPCLECGKAFSSNAILKLHGVIHKDIKPYSCQLCSAAFKLPHVLKNHMKTHSKDIT